MVHSSNEFCCLYEAGASEYNLARRGSLSNMPAPEFPQFSKLPPEIRNAIWRDAALEAYKNRLLVLGESHNRIFAPWKSSEKGIHVSPQMQQSAIFLASRESRRAARDIYNVPLHVYAISGTSNSYSTHQSFGKKQALTYKGEVYISLVHDVFVELDEAEVFEIEPDMIFDNFQDWDSYPFTGRLGTDQTASIKRLIVIHWLDFEGGYLSDESDVESEPDMDFLLDEYNIKHNRYYTWIEETFAGASSHYDLYLNTEWFDATTLIEILHGSARMLLQSYLDEPYFGILEPDLEDHDL
ncbi:hypothetical protein PG996_008208 [Apiospora saccharicola]|uniref:2EXR domain-containing protein n=1 Tax=Apiospora saccharicola TaxID=335842 RepID=A0ABR1UX95_9PEZI